MSNPLRVDEGIEAQYSRSRLIGGELLLTLVGTVGECAIASKELAGWNVARAVAVIPVERSVGAHWVKYILSAGPAKQRILERLNTTVQATLNLKDVAELPIPLPDTHVRDAILQVIRSLDDKIELNHRMNETLEAMARALFKDWFIDFGPVRAKVSDLVAERVMEIGDGYRAKNAELGGPGLPFLRAGDLIDGFNTHDAEVLHESGVANAGNKLSRPGDVAFTSKGTIGRFARVSEFTEPFVYSPQVCFWRSLDSQRLHPSVLYCWMTSDDLKAQIDAVAGQTDMAPYVSLRDQKEMEIPLFPESQAQIGVKLDALLGRQALAVRESRSLARLRDLLLPRLLSGELRIREAEKETEKVA